MEIKPIKILSISPNDKYKLTGRKGNLCSQTLEVDKSMVITFKNTGILRTSKVKEIIETDSGVEVKTKDSIYILKYQREE